MPTFISVIKGEQDVADNFLAIIVNYGETFCFKDLLSLVDHAVLQQRLCNGLAVVEQNQSLGIIRVEFLYFQHVFQFARERQDRRNLRFDPWIVSELLLKRRQSCFYKTNGDFTKVAHIVPSFQDVYCTIESVRCCGTAHGTSP